MSVILGLGTLLTFGCAARTIPPPAIPGAVAIADARHCGALASDEHVLWAAGAEPSGWFALNYELIKTDLDSNETAVWPLDTSGVYVGFGAELELLAETLWFTTRIGTPTVLLKIDSNSGAIVGELSHEESLFSSVAIGENAVWFAVSDMRSTHELLRVDPETTTVSAKIRLHASALDVAVTDGAVWVLHDDKTLSRIDPTTNRVLGAVRLPDDYTSLAATSNTVWLATSQPLFDVPPFLVALLPELGDKDSEGAVVARLDPRENKIVATIPFGEALGTVRTTDIFIDGNTIWVSFLVIPPEESQDSANRLWLAEIDATSSQLLRTTLVGAIADATARIAIVDNDVVVCGSTIWRIPLRGLGAASAWTTTPGLEKLATSVAL